VPGAVGRVAVPGKRPAAAIVMVVVAVGGGYGRHELRGDRRAGVRRPGSPGQLLGRDDPGLGVSGDMGAVAVPADLGRLAGVPVIRKLALICSKTCSVNIRR
jgi:hypothetical protein